ncbi:hypothetical protein JCM10450v2_002012 [Rhodotorula kratochvilovae]
MVTSPTEPGSWTKAGARSLPANLSVPPLPPLVHRQLKVHVAADGLVLRPYSSAQRGQYEGQAVRIPWATAQPALIDEWVEPDDAEGVEVDGVGGILAGFSDSYLVVITQSAVAAILPDPQQTTVRTARSLLAVPLGSLEAAQAVITKFTVKQAARRRRTASTASTASKVAQREGGAAASGTSEAPPSAETTDDSDSDSSADEADAAPLVVPQAGQKPKRPFWQRTFSRGFGKKDAQPAAAAVEEVAQADKPLPDAPSDAAEEAKDDPNEIAPPNATDGPALPAVAAAATSAPAAASEGTRTPDDEEVRESQRELDAKLVAECIRTMTGLYFSFTGDITHSLQARHETGTESVKHLPLWRLADKRYWFNRHLISPFVQAGLHSYILVLQQGFCSQSTVSLPLQPYRTLTSVDPSSPTSIDLDLVIISRRSTERPGLRYQRRGINDAGGVANFVETEFVVSCVREGVRHVCSFVQIRGSIPLYWSQSPWALKPPPVLERTKEESRAAMKRHLDGLNQRYGRVVIINLAEPTGREGAVVGAYRAGVERLGKDEKDLRYVEFDFHKETRGFKYENISKLLDDLKPDLEEMQAFWTTSSTSAVARWVMNRHLVHLGITTGEESGMHDDLDLAFNTLWADNGDAISREYAGTSALKGDFTRTGKRNWRGAMNDASNSVARMLQSTVTDFFKQAALDYILGVNLNAFQEFSARLETSDPGEILRLAKIRQEAIDTSCREVLPEGEPKLAAWTLLSPSPGEDAVRPPKGGKYEEKVLVLSPKAVYVVSYEYTLQKVSSSVRIPVGSIAGVQTGAYILSSLDAAARDPAENYGFLLRFHDDDATERVKTYSLRVTSPRKSPGKSGSSTPSSSSSLKPLKLPFATGKSASSASSTPPAQETHFIAFKALRRDAVKVAGADGESQIIDQRAGSDVEGKTARDVVRSIVARIREECERVGAVEEGEEGWVEERDIISVAESRAETSIVDKLTHSLYKAVWA